MIAGLPKGASWRTRKGGTSYTATVQRGFTVIRISGTGGTKEVYVPEKLFQQYAKQWLLMQATTLLDKLVYGEEGP